MAEVLEKDEPEYTLNERMYLVITKHKKFSKYAGILLISAMVIGVIHKEDLGTYSTEIIWSILVGIGVLYITLVAWRKLDARKVLDEYIRQNYFLSFQTLRPEGKNSLDKFMSLAKNVFPTIKKELKEYSKNELDWENQYDKLDGKYKFEISLKTDDGRFLLKYFPDSVKFEDVEKLVKIAKKYYDKDAVLRFVILSKKYDDIFFSDELSNKMELLIPSKPIKFKTLLSSGQIKKWIKLDLILERENGYTIIWLD